MHGTESFDMTINHNSSFTGFLWDKTNTSALKSLLMTTIH